MHFRNSCTRSTSTCCMRQVPSRRIGRPRLELLDALLRPEVPRHVGHEILDRRKGAHRLDRDRLGQVELVEPRHAHQARVAVDLGRARSALARLAVPADGQVVGLFGLNLVDGVEHDHALGDRGREVLQLSAAVPAAPDLEGRASSCVGSSMMAFSSSGISGIGARDSSIPPSRPLRTMRLKVAQAASLSG